MNLYLLCIYMYSVHTLNGFFPGDMDPNSVFQAFFADSNAGFNFGGGGAFPGGFTFHFQ